MGRALPWNDLFGESADEMSGNGMSSPDPDSSVPQAEASQGLDRDERAEPEPQQFVEKPQSDASPPSADITSSTTSASNLWTGLLNLFKPQAGQQKPAHTVQNGVRMRIRRVRMRSKKSTECLGKILSVARHCTRTTQRTAKWKHLPRPHSSNQPAIFSTHLYHRKNSFSTQPLGHGQSGTTACIIPKTSRRHRPSAIGR